MGRRPRRDRPVGDRPVGRLRDHYSAAARGGPLPPHKVLLPPHLAPLALQRPATATTDGRCVLELLRSALAAPAVGVVGERDRICLRHAAMGGGLGAHYGGRRPRIWRRPLHERYDVL